MPVKLNTDESDYMITRGKKVFVLERLFIMCMHRLDRLITSKDIFYMLNIFERPLTHRLLSDLLTALCSIGVE